MSFANKNKMDEKKNYQEWKTTILGVLTLILGVLVALGVIVPDQQAELTTSFTSLGEVIGGAITAISGLINVFRAK